MEGASAWTFLLQLAQRVSDMTEVTPVIQFDKNFDVDISEIKLINDYFKLNSVHLDPETNIMTLKLNWIKQTAAIEAESANPLCIVNGIKLTPKADAGWDDKSTLSVVNKGDISYKIYLRASGLYSFSLKPENQATYGLQPFVNPNDSSEKGGYLSDVYAQFEDSYKLVNAVKNGWHNEDGGFAFYEDGQRYFGIREAEGYYYDFGEKGVNMGQTKLTGLFYDETAGVYRYAKNGLLQSGWQMIDAEWYYFVNNAAVSGQTTVQGIPYTFEENGKLTTGTWVKTSGGYQYWYGPSLHLNRWLEVDGEWYYFKNGYRLTGYQQVSSYELITDLIWYDFGEDGIARPMPVEGFYEHTDGGLHYIVDSRSLKDLQKVGEDYYFFLPEGAVKGQRYYAYRTQCDLPVDNYEFGSDGKMLQGFVKKTDGIYYYVNGKAGREYGLRKIDGDY